MQNLKIVSIFHGRVNEPSFTPCVDPPGQACSHVFTVISIIDVDRVVNRRRYVIIVPRRISSGGKSMSNALA